MSSSRRLLAFLVALPLTTGCNLFQTSEGEGILGRGPKAFDPYTGPGSGAIRLGLQWYNGCAHLSTGEPVGKGNANIPYPTQCSTFNAPDPNAPSALVTPTRPMKIKAGENYFLQELALMDEVVNVHNNQHDMSAVVAWIRDQSRFRALDWNNLAQITDDWEPSIEAGTPGAFTHDVQFGNANWQNQQYSDTFLVEILNTSGAVVQSALYTRADFLVETAAAGHTRVGWEYVNIAPPRFPGDLDSETIPIPPAPNGYLPYPDKVSRSYVRTDMIVATHPNKTFKLDPGLTGDGAIRVTWSQMSNDPFYFPVEFVPASAIDATCYDGADPTRLVACDFGLDPRVELGVPKNGQYYEPGEIIELQLSIHDGVGNYLHQPDHFPSWNDYINNKANGILYFNTGEYQALKESDTITLFRVVGPSNVMRPHYEIFDRPYYQFPPDLPVFIGDFVGGANLVQGARDVPFPTRYPIPLTMDAKPGTYYVAWKVSRSWLGERFTKLVMVPFQVGTNQPSSFPGRVGNCQICHRGVISLDNVRHGLGVDFVEGCKTCHNRSLFPFQRVALMQRFIHRIHMFSPKFPLPKNDCTTCHLTRESPLRASYVVCSACHAQPHGTTFFNITTQPDYPENGSTNVGGGYTLSVWGNCSLQCHSVTPPTAHILPAE